MKEEHNKKIWFRRKWYGWGWYPATWEGWVITALYVAIIVFFASTVSETSTTREILLMMVLPFILATTAFIKIAYMYGETPRWQWGKPKQDSSKSHKTH